MERAQAPIAMDSSGGGSADLFKYAFHIDTKAKYKDAKRNRMCIHHELQSIHVINNGTYTFLLKVFGLYNIV